jgi:hypothetical protein
VFRCLLVSLAAGFELGPRRAIPSQWNVVLSTGSSPELLVRPFPPFVPTVPRVAKFDVIRRPASGIRDWHRRAIAPSRWRRQVGRPLPAGCWGTLNIGCRITLTRRCRSGGYPASRVKLPKLYMILSSPPVQRADCRHS